MVKHILLALLILPLFAACGKQEPPAPPAPQTAAPTPAPTPAPEAAPPIAAPAAPVAGAGNLAKGEDTYKKTCSVCHAVGVAGAPKFGDKAAWAPRIAQGTDTLHTHALKGFQGKTGMMPPKGGPP
jgi:cytochrome c5